MRKHTIRTTNLLLLQAYLNKWGSPTLAHFSAELKSKGVRVDPNSLSLIVRNEEELPCYKNGQIEKAYGLPDGWMDMDKTFLLSIGPGDLKLLRQISDLPAEKRKCLSDLVGILSS